MPDRFPLRLLLALPLALSPMAAATSAATTPEPPRGDPQSFDALVARAVKRFGIAGAAVAVVDDGEIVLAKGYGMADCESGTPVTTDTRFNIGSISKMVSAWGIMQLVDQGVVDLDKPVWKYVRTWKLPESKFDRDGVTVRRLLSHTAGLSLHGYPGYETGEPLPTLRESLSGATNGAGDVQLFAQPGTTLRYSGGGFSLLQLMCEELAEKPFAEYMQEVCFDPLGMKRTGFNRDPKLSKNTARPHGLVHNPVPDRNFRAEAAAAVYTTLDDFVRFALAHFDMGTHAPAGRSVLSPAGVALLGSSTPDSHGRWAHGPMIISGANENAVIGHGGDNHGWHAQIALQLAGRDALIVMTNGDAGPALREFLMRPWSDLVGIEPLLATYRPPGVIAVTGHLLDDGAGAAIEEYLHLLEEAPLEYDFDHGAFGRLAVELLESENAGDALELLALAVDLAPNVPYLWAVFAEAHWMLGDESSARAACQQSLDLDPEQGQALALLVEMG